MRHLVLGALALILPAGGLVTSAGDFRMTVGDAFTITGRGVVVTGIVEGGPVAVEDVVCLRPADGRPRELTVVAIERFRQELDTAEPGSAVGLLFEGIEVSDVKVGDTLTASCD